MHKIQVLRRIRRTVFAGFLALLTLISGSVNSRLEGDVYPYASVTRIVGLDALDCSQGVTTDGTDWIYSGKTSLIKISADSEEVLAYNKKAIPAQMRTQLGSRHIGGISFANGYVYAAIEDSKVWKHPVVALYNAETLEYSGRFVELPGKDSGSAQALTQGVPWVACDTENGVFYVAQCRNAQELYAYDLETLAYQSTIPLRTSVDRIQGGEMYCGYLYVATNDDARAVYRIRPDTGEVEHYFDRILAHSDHIANFGGEGEDMTVLPMQDGTIFHALNIGALFVDANLRHYAPVPGKPLEIEKEPDDPSVLYVQKYVSDILASNNYTLKIEATDGAKTLPLTCYRSGADMTYEMTVSDLLANMTETDYPFLSSLGSNTTIRVILKGVGTSEETVYLSTSIGYVELNDFSAAEMGLDVEDVLNGNLLEIGLDTLTFVRSEGRDGVWSESFINAEGDTLYVFYFTSRGLCNVQTIDPVTMEVLSDVRVSLMSGVANSNVFTPSGRRLEIEEIERLFG